MHKDRSKLLCAVIWLVSLVQLLECKLTFDFVIVGSGAGGGCLARRLVENESLTVLLLEAGGLPRDGHDIPARAPEFFNDAGVTFTYQSVPQQNAALLTNGTAYAVSGKMLGGTTSLNYMWFNRGHPRDWDNWANVTGDPSWEYENMMSYFLKVENYKGDFPSEQHGLSGPITVSQPQYSPGLEQWLEAGRELNYPVADPNGPQQRSFTPLEYSKSFGKRVSSASGYLGPVYNSPNLHVLLNSTVTKVIFEGNRAVGVRYVSTSKRDDLEESVAYATKEVVLSAGSYNSPLILQRSGIGPKDILAAANIPLVKDLPVGQNLHDHPLTILTFVLNNPDLVMDEERDLNAKSWKFFNSFGDGPYSSTKGMSGQAFVSSSVAEAKGQKDWPDIHLGMCHTTQEVVSDDLFSTSLVNVRPGEAPFSSWVFVGRPYSRGSIAINPDDSIWGNPVLDFGWLTDARDTQIMLDGIRETLSIYEDTNAYRNLATRYSPVDLPACKQFQAMSDDYWVCYMKQVVLGGCHPAGTNKMGKYDDPSAVVDNELRVIGVEGLRVVDGSIMPFIVNSNPQAAIYAIAERIADIIKANWKQ